MRQIIIERYTTGVKYNQFLTDEDLDWKGKRNNKNDQMLKSLDSRPSLLFT